MKLGTREVGSASCRVMPCDGVPEHMRDAMREIIDLVSSNPRKGHATALMTRLCAEADEARITLLLTPKAFQDGMTDVQLMKWYARFGFTAIQHDPVVMARQVFSGDQIVRH